MLAILLLAVSFFDLGAGISGLLAILITQWTAILFNFNHELVRDGSYSYNSAMVGVGIGIFYTFNFSLLVLLIISSVLTFFLTIWFYTRLAKSGLPFLSIPFLIVTWLIILGGQNFSALTLQTKSLLTVEKIFPEFFTIANQWVASLPFADLFHLYFRSVGAILFQYNDFAGIIVAIALLFASRITFVLSLYGFMLGFLFYKYMEADFTHLIYSYIGFNFILTAIALGGFFIVASRRSLLLLLFSIPVIALIISSLHGLFTSVGLPLYSLPFNVVVLLILYAINQRVYAAKLIPVKFQHYSPEINHYKYFNYIERYKRETGFHISPPFMGNWTVAQGQSGSLTHKDDYRFAWDFDVRDENNKTFRGNGYELKDYYCYDLPVLAPGMGYVVALIDNVDDNQIGQVDVKNNWGNTLIIKHQDFLYSKLSHLKKGSFKVKVGDWVNAGQVVANCGNSGRSPEPHLHFQIQSAPYVGSKTIRYPLSYYLKSEDKQLFFKTFDFPAEGETISKPNVSALLADAFQLIPGKILTWQSQTKNATETIEWEVFTDSLNQSYIFCRKSKATAYFINNGTLFYFTNYYGKKNTLLHHFYKAAYKVILGAYPDIAIDDPMEITDTLPKPLTFLHDFFAPAFHFLKTGFISKSLNFNSPHNPTSVEIKSECRSQFFEKQIQKQEYTLKIEKEEKLRLTLFCPQANLTAQCENDLF